MLLLIICLSASVFGQSDMQFLDTDNNLGILLYENPANEKAEFEVSTPEATDVSVLIYDNQGNVLFSQKGKTQKNGNINSLKIVWDLTNRSGRRVTGGTYIIQATAKNTNANQIYQYFIHLGVKK
jgi:flagellar hook assembly protein FlgD